MNFLLDTHVFLWWSLEPDKLPSEVLDELRDPKNRVVFSTVCSWEAQIKAGLGKLVLEEPLRKIVERELSRNQWEVLPVTLEHTWRLESLPPLHRDPFDRLLVAQALVENLSLVTRDPLLPPYPDLRTFWRV
jgi:PIN domain nuclease of toxin-antitoxin system